MRLFETEERKFLVGFASELTKKVKMGVPSIILGYLDLIDKVIDLLELSPEKLTGGDADIQIAVLSGYTYDEKLIWTTSDKLFGFKGKSYLEIKEKLTEMMALPRMKHSPLFIRYGHHTETGGFDSGTEFMYEDSIKNPKGFFDKNWEFYFRFSHAGYADKETVIQKFKQCGEQKNGITRIVTINTWVRECPTGIIKEKLQVDWETGFYYKKK